MSKIWFQLPFGTSILQIDAMTREVAHRISWEFDAKHERIFVLRVSLEFWSKDSHLLIYSSLLNIFLMKVAQNCRTFWSSISFVRISQQLFKQDKKFRSSCCCIMNSPSFRIMLSEDSIFCMLEEKDILVWNDKLEGFLIWIYFT